MRGSGLAIAVVVVVVGVLGGRAQADTARQRADALFAEGRKLIDRDPRAACDKFEAAIGLDPTAPGVMLNLGLCYERLRKLATSLYWFRKAQIAASEAGLPDFEEAAKERTTDLATKVATMRVDVSQAPPDVQVTLDGRLIPRTEYARVEVDEGTNVLEARAAGWKPFRKEVQVTARDHGAEAIVLEKLDPVRIDRGRGRRIGAFALGGAGIALLATSGIYAKMAYDDYNDNPMKNSETRAAADRKINIGTGLFVGGAVAVGAGVLLYLTAPKPERREATAIVPVITPAHAGLTITGAF